MWNSPWGKSHGENHMGNLNCEKSIRNFTCDFSHHKKFHLWKFTCEISDVNFHMRWSTYNIVQINHIRLFICEISHVTFHIWNNFPCEISHVKFPMWKVTSEISHEKHMWKITCENSHVKHMTYAHGFHMWKNHMCFWNFTCETHVLFLLGLGSKSVNIIVNLSFRELF